MFSNVDPVIERLVRDNINGFNPDQLTNADLAACLRDPEYRAGLEECKRRAEAKHWLRYLPTQYQLSALDKQLHRICLNAFFDRCDERLEKLVNVGRGISGKPGTK